MLRGRWRGREGHTEAQGHGDYSPSRLPHASVPLCLCERLLRPLVLNFATIPFNSEEFSYVEWQPVESRTAVVRRLISLDLDRRERTAGGSAAAGSCSQSFF